jgi:carbamoyl-phosphate synthase large subunit
VTRQVQRNFNAADPLRVLVFPGGTEIGLEVGKALRYCKEISLFSTGSDVPNHAPYVFARHSVLPDIRQDGWVDALNRVIVQNRIDVIIPAYDEIILALAENADRLAAPVISSPPDACRITRAKSLTYRALKDIVPVPRMFGTPEEVERYPVFVKPDRGQGSEGAKKVSDEAALRDELRRTPDLLVLELLTGPEYTVDCFSDRDRGLLFCQGRIRVRTKSGISMASRHSHQPEFSEWGAAIGKRLGLRGAWFFQAKENARGELRLLEVAPRVAGAMCLNRVLGVNFPLLSLYEHFRLPYQILTNKVEATLERSLINRYSSSVVYDAVYVDLDDTLIINGSVNLELIRFLYQCVNAGKHLCLLSRHAKDPVATLERYRLAGLFDEIIHIDRVKLKSEYIQRRPAIFIDDSFRERREVAESLGIPTFDSSMIEGLLDDRM